MRKRPKGEEGGNPRTEKALQIDFVTSNADWGPLRQNVTRFTSSFKAAGNVLRISFPSPTSPPQPDP